MNDTISNTDKMAFGAIKCDTGGYYLYGNKKDNTEIDDFVDKCKYAEYRLALSYKYIWNNYPDRDVVKYKNWLQNQFPILQGSFNFEMKKTLLFDELPDDVKTACYKAEKHMFIDLIFEEYLFKNIDSVIIKTKEDWEQLPILQRHMLLNNFKFFL